MGEPQLCDTTCSGGYRCGLAKEHVALVDGLLLEGVITVHALADEEVAVGDRLDNAVGGAGVGAVA